jgi:signal transduction histidine kinase
LKREPDNGYAGVARAYFRDVLEITQQMERLVTALLSIVRCDASRQTTRKESVEMRDLIREISNPYRAEAQARNICFRLDLPDTAVVESDSSLLTVVFNNLFANAINHTPEGGEVRADLATNTDSLLFTIANTNDQIEPDDLGFLFDPFWRKDPSRSGESGHGLGLSVVKSCADLLGLRVQVCLKDPQMVTFQIRIPRPSASRNHFPIGTTETE